MSEIISALKIGELMMEQELTWQAAAVFALLFGFGIVFLAWCAAKVVKAWREALK